MEPAERPMASGVSAPFDGVAAEYDRIFTESEVGRVQRMAVWSALSAVFKPGYRILELNCGTGVDALHLAECGMRVLALDASEAMVQVARRRIREHSAEKQVQVECWPTEQITELETPVPFDGVLSNFGGLNCVRDLEGTARHLHHLIRPGGAALLCWMNRWCLWEIAHYLWTRTPAKAFRRTRGHAVASVNQGPSFSVYYPSLSSILAAFSPWFRCISARAIGLLVPPSYLEKWARSHPAYLNQAVRWDEYLSHWRGLRALGDHLLVHFENRSD
ncbi:MAG: class I SAM-dependent methyltransferase [Acidobacteriota bacterium]